jgi:predicted methyltransferase
MFKDVEIVNLFSNLSEPDSVDAVLTFRNLHNWLGPDMDRIFSNSFKALKPGGLFGVVEHRAKPGSSMETMKKSGYVTEQHAIKIARKHGFELVSKSEINANPKDSTDHPKGVWTLPPNFRLKDIDKDKYEAIGESDRMTLLFRKPLAA